MAYGNQLPSHRPVATGNFTDGPLQPNEAYLFPGGDAAGTKADTGKLRWDLLPFDALEAVVSAYTVGSIKYDDWNWAKGIHYSRVIGALLRHLVAWWWKRECHAPDDGQHHLAAVVWNALTLLHYDLNHPKYKEFDDRR
jgi:hypothetical protein